MTPKQVVEAYCDAWMAGDTMAVLSLYHPDLTLIWPGRHHLAGVHEGLNASIEALLALQALTNRRPIEIVEVAEGRDAVVLLVVERWSHPDDAEKVLETRRALEYTVAEDKLRTCRVYESEQGAIDDWINASRAT
jgi:uncharacterized protein